MALLADTSVLLKLHCGYFDISCGEGTHEETHSRTDRCK